MSKPSHISLRPPPGQHDQVETLAAPGQVDQVEGTNQRLRGFSCSSFFKSLLSARFARKAAITSIAMTAAIQYAYASVESSSSVSCSMADLGGIKSRVLMLMLLAVAIHFMLVLLALLVYRLIARAFLSVGREQRS